MSNEATRSKSKQKLFPRNAVKMNPKDKSNRILKSNQDNAVCKSSDKQYFLTSYSQITKKFPVDVNYPCWSSIIYLTMFESCSDYIIFKFKKCISNAQP